MARVLAANDEMVKALTHPITRVGFVDTATAVTWPDDQFTARRIIDGDVLIEGATKEEERKQPEVRE